ncbi:MAG: hypothetical protein OXH92_21825 [Bryobacterales bacterium]|nr:hypothetical protein [Bryobacterales bacterium]
MGSGLLGRAWAFVRRRRACPEGFLINETGRRRVRRLAELLALGSWLLPLCPGQETGSTDTAGASAAASEAAVPAAAPADAPAAAGNTSGNVTREELNLLGQVDSDAGESRRNENVSINLIDNNVLKELNIRMGTTATIVEEFKPDRGYFGAEFGSAPSAPFHLSPTSASGVHGSVYWSHDNSLLRARSFFQVGEVQPARDNDYGLDFSAPTWRGGHFTLDASQQRLRGNVNGNILVPAVYERTPLATDPAVRAFVQRILDGYPNEEPNRTDIDPHALNTNAPQIINNDNIGGTLDQQFSENDQLVLRYQLTSQKVDAFQLYGGQNPDTTTKSHDARASWIHSWSPSTVTEFSGGFKRIGSLLVSDETSIGPVILTSNLWEYLGPSSDIPIDRAQNEFRYAGALRHTRGRHLYTAGFELLRRQVNGIESNSHRGLFSFRADFGQDNVTNILQGRPSSYSIALGNAHRGFRNWEMQYYFGDDWKVNSNLTLNLGLRFQPVTAPDEVNGLTNIPYRCDCNNWAPRFGAAYRLGRSGGVLRAAYGTHFGSIYTVTYSQARFNSPQVVRLSLPQPDILNPLGGIDPDDIDPNQPSVLFDLVDDLVAPYSHQYNFSWEREVFGKATLRLGYVGSRSPKLLTLWYFNRARPVEGIERITRTINQRRPDQRLLDIRRTLNGSFGYYDAAKVSLSVAQWRGFSLDASYWFSKAIDLGSGYTNTAAGRDGRRARPQSGVDAHGDMKGLSSFDQPHAALWRATYGTPSLAKQPGWIKNLLGGWELFTVVLLKSGTPFTVRSGSDAPGFGNVDGSGSDRVNVLDPSVLGRVIDHPDTSRQMLPTSAFGFISPQDVRGNIGRNTFRKDGIRNINFALARRWPFGGDNEVSLRAESINFFNTPQFAEPGRNVSNDNFAAITNTLNDGRTFRFTLRIGF